MIVSVKADNGEYNKRSISLLGFALFFSGATYGLKAIVSGLGLSSLEGIASLIIYIIWFCKLLYFVYKDIRALGRILIWELIYIGLLYFSYKKFPYTRIYYEESKMFLRQIMCVFIPCGAIVSTIRSFDGCFESMRRICWIGSIIMVVSFALGYTKRWGNQYLGVHMTPFILILYVNFLKNKKTHDLLIVIIQTILVLAGGRQSLVIVVSGLVLLYFFVNIKKTINIVFICLVLILLVVVIFVSGDTILTSLSSLMNLFGVDSRVLNMLGAGDLFDTSTRDIIYEISMENIVQNGVRVSGFFADRYYLRLDNSWIVYAHNILLEILLDFGLFVGPTIVVMLVSWIVINIIKGTLERKTFAVMLCIFSLLRLFVSSSFMIEGSFYILIGFLLNGLKYARKKSVDSVNDLREGSL